MIFYAIGLYLLGLGLYMIFGGNEAPEGFQIDVEHDSAGKPLAKTNPLYWFSVVAEFLFSKPSAFLKGLVKKR